MVGVDRFELSNACVSDMCVYHLHHTPINKMHAIMQYIGFEPMSLALLLAL